MRGLCLLLPVLAFGALFVPAAQANGDPASDVLLAQDVFLPYDGGIPSKLARDLTDTIAEANKGGYRIKVALIAAPVDLGLIQELWLKPKKYAPFLGAELRFIYKDTLVVVMPNGFGVYCNERDVDREERLLAGIRIGPGAAGLAEAARVAVRRLAAASGHPVGGSGGGSDVLDRVLIAVGSAVVLVVLVFLGRELRRRHQPSSEAGP
jgi:hypothetical protein